MDETRTWLAQFVAHATDEAIRDVRFSEGMTMSVNLGRQVRLGKRSGNGQHELSIFFGYEWSVVPPHGDEARTSREVSRETLTEYVLGSKLVSVRKGLDANLEVSFSSGAVVRTCPVDDTDDYEPDWNINDVRMPEGRRWLDPASYC